MAAIAPYNLTRFLTCSPVQTIRANFYLSLKRLGKSDDEINEAYAEFLPIGGEEELMKSFTWSKVRYLPFIGFILARYNPMDYNTKGTISEYAKTYGLSIPFTTMRDMQARILSAYNRSGKKGVHASIDLADWGQQYWS